MTAYLCMMTIYDVTIYQPHRFLVSKAHVLYASKDSNNCGNVWYRLSTMCDVADAIYCAIDALINDPAKFVDQGFMMSIFTRWLKKVVACYCNTQHGSFNHNNYHHASNCNHYHHCSTHHHYRRACNYSRCRYDRVRHLVCCNQLLQLQQPPPQKSL